MIKELIKLRPHSTYQLSKVSDLSLLESAEDGQSVGFGLESVIFDSTSSTSYLTDDHHQALTSLLQCQLFNMNDININARDLNGFHFGWILTFEY